MSWILASVIKPDDSSRGKKPPLVTVMADLYRLPELFLPPFFFFFWKIFWNWHGMTPSHLWDWNVLPFLKHLTQTLFTVTQTRVYPQERLQSVSNLAFDYLKKKKKKIVCNLSTSLNNLCGPFRIVAQVFCRDNWVEEDSKENSKFHIWVHAEISGYLSSQVALCQQEGRPSEHNLWNESRFFFFFFFWSCYLSFSQVALCQHEGRPTEHKLWNEYRFFFFFFFDCSGQHDQGDVPAAHANIRQLNHWRGSCSLNTLNL